MASEYYANYASTSSASADSTATYGLCDYIQYDETHVLMENQFLSTRLFGGPLMYTDAVDPKIIFSSSGSSLSMGRTTATTIMHNPTIISLQPCKVKAVNLTKSNKAVTLLLNGLAGGDESISDELADAFDSDKALFTLKPDYNTYMNNVNLIARVMAIFMGIGEDEVVLPTSDGVSRKVTGYLYRNMDWRQYQMGSDISDVGDTISTSDSWDEDSSADDGESSGMFSNFRGLFNSFLGDPTNFVLKHQGYVHFYGQNSSSYQEDFTSTTRESAVGAKINSLNSLNNDYIKDALFLTGVGNASDTAITNKISELASGLDQSDNSILELVNSATDILKGGHMVFPQMVEDSTYGKSMSVTFKFVSPSGDPKSVFMNVMLPLAHAMALALPKQMSTNIYTYPFLVKLFSKGWMNCEMGLVTGFRIQRGGSDDNQYTASNLATEVDVTMDITPLYNALMMSSSAKPFGFIKNDGLQEYLGTICGLNMKGDTISVKKKIVQMLLSSQLETWNPTKGASMLSVAAEEFSSMAAKVLGMP